MRCLHISYASAPTPRPNRFVVRSRLRRPCSTYCNRARPVWWRRHSRDRRRERRGRGQPSASPLAAAAPAASRTSASSAGSRSIACRSISSPAPAWAVSSAGRSRLAWMPARSTPCCAAIDWDEMFGSSSFKFKNIRRKADARAYPTRLEFGVKRGIVRAAGSEQWAAGGAVARADRGPGLRDRRLRRTADALPGRGRGSHRRQQVILDRGSLSQAMRATMSLP